MPKTKKVTKKKVTKKAKDCYLEVSFNDSVFRTETDTLLEALTNFVGSPKFPTAIKTKVFLKYGANGAERHKLLNIPRARAMFNRMSFNPSVVELFADKLMHELTF